ncbi:hypothetical protein PINS_up011237 [Pythium insidiosum]|nr:hypothetical protein PINS_up011237 [Pythium insidiosum]
MKVQEADTADLPNGTSSYTALADIGDGTPPSVSRSWIDTIFFTRGNPIYAISQERALDFPDLLALQHEYATSTCYARFEKSYERHGRSLHKAMIFVYGKMFAWCGLGQLFVAASAVFAPVVLNQVVSAFTDRDSAGGGLDFARLSAWLCAFFITRILTVIVNTQVQYASNHIAIRVTAAMKSFLFRKALQRDLAAAQTGDEGTKSKTAEISNLVSSDTNGILYAVLALHNLWILPLQVVVVTYLLYNELDVAAFAGISVVVASLSSNYAIARVMGGAFAKLMRVKDARMRTVKEVFGAIQIVKFNAWEARFQAKLMNHRVQELGRLATYGYASAASTFVLWSAPLFVSAVSFVVYSLVLGRTLTAAKVFTAMALFNALRDPLRDLPTTIQSLIQSRISMQRIDSYLSSANYDESRVERMPSKTEAPAIRVVDGHFSWMEASFGGSKATLEDVNLEIHQGDFAVVFGSIGAGKSSLLNAILGEMNKQRGQVMVRGRVAYYSQQPWIQNMTVRENILFGSPFDPDRYAAVLDACCLRDDLALLQAGDATEIGERGVNLSGGQKARIALARACYADADIYLLDSPLAAVDTVVQKSIMARCLCGLLRGKTVVLVTHNPEILQSRAVNCRILVNSGRISSIERSSLVDCDVSNAVEAISDEVRDQGNEHLGLKSDNGVLVEEETRQDGQINTAIWSRYISSFGGKRLLVLLVIVQLLWQALQIGSDVWLSHWTGENSDDAERPREDIVRFVRIYSALTGGGALMLLIFGGLVACIGLRASSRLFDDMTDGLLHAPIRFFDANPIGRLINRYADDVAAIDLLIPPSCSAFVTSFFSTVCALVTAGVTIKYVGLCVLPMIYIYVRIAKGYVRTFCDVRRMLKVVNSPILSHITECEQGVSILRAFGSPYIARAITENHRRIDVDNALWDTEIVMIQWFALRMQFLGCAILLLVIGSFLVFSDWFSAGTVGLAFTYSLSIDGSLMALMKAWSKAENNMVSVERVIEYSALPREGGIHPATTALAAPLAPLWPERGEIVFEHVWFAYKPGGAPVLRDVSISVRSRERIGIVGRTGAGKSSLTMALFRMNELHAGRILVDGVDIAAVPLEALRSRLAIIPQSPVLLEGPLRHFLDPFDDFSDDQVIRALEHVDLLPLLRSVAKSSSASTDSSASPSVDTSNAALLQIYLSANGANFSVGERQLLCMARALLRRSSIVIMDEATAAMDHATEHKLSQMIRREMTHVTLLTIAHRLATVLDSDRILVLDAGRVVEFDAPQVLLQDETSAFSSLVRSADMTSDGVRTTV